MMRSVGIVMIVWGLIVQPLMAAMLTESSQSIAVVDSGVIEHVIDQDVEDLLEASCHDNATDSATSESCDNCDIDCMNGICASSCMMGGAIAFQKSSVNLDLFSTSFVAAFSGARAYGLPSRIFHPPKHA